MTRGIAGLERLAQTDVRQDAHYNSCLGKWKDYLPFTNTGVLPLPRRLRLPPDCRLHAIAYSCRDERPASYP